MALKHKVGKFGESLASDFLLKRKHKILGTNIKLSYQELDIVSKKNDLIIFTEVKTRTNNTFDLAEYSVNQKKIKNLKKAITNYLIKNNLSFKNFRLDLIIINIKNNKKIAEIKRYKDII